MPSKYSALCLLALVAYACQQKPAETTTPPLPAATTAAAVTAAAEPTVAQRFSPIISGYWVSVDYLNEIARTRSPAASFDKVVSPASLAIRPFSTQKDSVEIGASYGLHEGGDLVLLLQPGTEANSLKIKLRYGGATDTTEELAYQLTPTDTLLFYITRRTKTHRIISKNAYRRTGMPGNENNMEPAVERGVNDLLVTGNYIGKDSANQPIKAQFFTGGLVKGLPFQKYSVRTDFTGPNNSGDAIIFDEYTKSEQELGASFGHDTLKLYIINSTIGVPAGKTDTIEIFTRGRLRYQLVRVKKP